MIPRYTRPQMAKIWSDENRLATMLEVEVLAAEAMAAQGRIPRSAAQTIRRRARIDASRIADIERTVKHDVIAFLTQVGETVGPSARFLHLGMTSSDVLDTALGVQLRQSCQLLVEGIARLERTVKRLAKKYKRTPMMGRTHGVHAEPITFGLKMASWYSEVRRMRALMESTLDIVSFGKISGAVGTFAHIDPRVEAHVCRKLGLRPEPVSSQIVPRDRHAVYLCRIALIGSSLERFAVEVRHLQRTEVREAEEPFTEGQKGSSAMPHKRNPILSENVTGLARLLRGFAVTGMENIALWHERDISHSAAERVILPDASIALDFMLARMNHVLEGLVVYPENMRMNLARSQDVIHSGTLLLALVDTGMSREDAYAMVQRAAFAARDEKVSFAAAAARSPEVARRLSTAEIKRCCDTTSHFRSIDRIFVRCGIQ